jgi:hypothetical protein
MRVLILVLLLCPVCFAQPVTVRVVSGKDGHPLPKQAVSVQFFYDKPAKVSPSLDFETDSNGEAQFDLPEPAPVHLNVRITLPSEHWHCACGFMGDTEMVVEKGVVQGTPDKTKTPVAAPKVEAGHIVFVARPFTFVERLLYPLVKE